MKKILAGILFGSLVLSGCSFSVSEGEADGETKVDVKVEGPEEGEKRKASEITAEGDPIPFDEFDILENDEDAYQNRPFENVPVHIESVERNSDHSVIRASYDGDVYLHFALLVDGNDIDFAEGDHGYLSGVVANDIDTDSFSTLMAIEGAFKSFEKIDEMAFHNPNVVEHEINQTKSNDYFEATVEKIVTGDAFTVIYYSYDRINKDEDPLTYASFDLKTNDEILARASRYDVGLETELEGEHEIFTELDVTQPFKIEIQSVPDFGEMRDYEGKNTDPLVFEFDGI